MDFDIWSASRIDGTFNAGRDISGKVTGNTAVYRVSAGESITDKVEATSGTVYLVQANDDVSGEVKAGLDIFHVLAGTDATDDISGQVTAGGAIGKVVAGGSISDKIEAVGNLWLVQGSCPCRS